MSVADELTKLVALRDSGALSQEEFDQQRAILLATPAVVSAASWGPTSQAGPGMACGRCQKPLSPAWRGKCNHCGAPTPSFRHGQRRLARPPLHR
jgi:predicted amidophosphoribosyltransferase